MIRIDPQEQTGFPCLNIGIGIGIGIAIAIVFLIYQQNESAWD